jgi:hypothetical protein
VARVRGEQNQRSKIKGKRQEAGAEAKQSKTPDIRFEEDFGGYLALGNSKENNKENTTEVFVSLLFSPLCELACRCDCLMGSQVSFVR